MNQNLHNAIFDKAKIELENKEKIGAKKVIKVDRYGNRGISLYADTSHLNKEKILSKGKFSWTIEIRFHFEYEAEPCSQNKEAWARIKVEAEQTDDLGEEFEIHEISIERIKEQ